MDENVYIHNFIKYLSLIIFISYATPDSIRFDIPNIARGLENYPEIMEALYWEEDSNDNIVDYMNINIPKCDIFILFCSIESLNSEFVNLEWKTALEMRRKIIPVFQDTNHIPPILRSMLGVEYNESDMEDLIQKIYTTIGKKLKIPLEYENVLTISQINQQIQDIQEEFQLKLNNSGVSRDLEMRILIYPVNPKESFIKRNQIKDLKRNLERNMSRGLMVDSAVSATIFDGLKVNQNGFFSISNHDNVGSIIIKKNGFVIYNLHYNKDKKEKIHILQTYYMTAYFLGLLELLQFFFNEIGYSGDMKLIFQINHIHDWLYSPYKKNWLPYDYKQFSNAKFTPIEKTFSTQFINNVTNRFEIVEEIFSEMILGYGETTKFNIPDDFKNQYRRT